MSAFAIVVCITVYLTREISSSVHARKCGAMARFATTFFSTRGTWYGYVLRVGILWFACLMTVRWYWNQHDEGLPFSSEELLWTLCCNTVLGALFGCGSYGVLRGSEDRRRSAAAERTDTVPAGANPRWPMWMTEGLCARGVFTATLIGGDCAGFMFTTTDHDVVFYIVVGIAVLLICLVTLIYFRANSRNHRSTTQITNR